MAVSEKQRIANRLNAAKSRGPKTAEGKANSRANSLKHGMTGQGVVLPRALRDLARREQVTMEAALRPTDAAQAALVEAAALACARMKSSQAQIEAAAVKRHRAAVADFDARREEEVAELAALLDGDPAGAVRRLRRTTEGCEWLICQIEPLRDWLDGRGSFTADQIDRLLKLLGLASRPTLASEPGPAAWMLDLLAVGPEPSDEELERFFVLPAGEARGFLPSAEEACAALAERFEAVLENLDQLRHHLWETIDKPDRDEAPLRALEDTTVEGARLVRYQMTAIATLQRSIAAVKKLQKDAPRRSALPPRNEPISAPSARQNEPISPPGDRVQTPHQQGVKSDRPSPAPAAGAEDAALAKLLSELLAATDGPSSGLVGAA